MKEAGYRPEGPVEFHPGLLREKQLYRSVSRSDTKTSLSDRTNPVVDTLLRLHEGPEHGASDEEANNEPTNLLGTGLVGEPILLAEHVQHQFFSRCLGDALKEGDELGVSFARPG